MLKCLHGSDQGTRAGGCAELNGMFQVQGIFQTRALWKLSHHLRLESRCSGGFPGRGRRSVPRNLRSTLMLIYGQVL